MQKFITDLEQYIVNLEKYMKETVAEMLHQDMPVLLEEKFAIYEKTGSRMEYEWDYFARRKFLSIFGVAAIWMKREGMQKLGEVTFEEVVDKLEQVLLNICGEECWAVPAHVKRDVDPDWRNTIDLFGSETAQTLALITKEMGDSLSADCRSTVKENVSRRVVDNFFQSPVDTRWWEHGDNNWNAVCNGNVMSAYLHSLKDGETPREDYIARICDGLTRFIDGYSEDGTCLEGMAYFTYGMGYFSNVAFDLYDYTDGKIDLLQGDWYKFKAGQQDKRARICEWWPKCFFKGNKTVSFADGRDNDKYRLGFSCDLARIFPNVTFPSIEMAQNFAEDHNQRFMFLYKDLFSTKRYLQELKEHHEDVKQKEQSGSRFDILESAQWVIAESENGMGMACKGGHNMEPHNHNDITNFFYMVGEDMFVEDLGAGEYTKAYFEFKGRRYTILCNSSRGHNVPVIAGQEQLGGAEHCCSRFEAEVQENLGIARIDGEKAYPEGTIYKYSRKLTFNKVNGDLEIRDYFDNKGQEITVTESFISKFVPEIQGNTVIFKSDKGSCCIEAVNGAELHISDIRIVPKEHSMHNTKKITVYLIQWDFQAADATEAVIRITGKIN